MKPSPSLVKPVTSVRLLLFTVALGLAASLTGCATLDDSTRVDGYINTSVRQRL